jgi:hypothetical protein
MFCYTKPIFNFVLFFVLHFLGGKHVSYLFMLLRGMSPIACNINIIMVLIGLYHSLDGITNLKYTLLCFLTPNKIIFKEKGTSF